MALDDSGTRRMENCSFNASTNKIAQFKADTFSQAQTSGLLKGRPAELAEQFGGLL